MIIRWVWIGSLLALLGMVLYIPSAATPEELIGVIRAEHRMNERLWGPEGAERIMVRMLDLQAGARQVSAPPLAAQPRIASSGASDAAGVNAAMATQLGQMGGRLFNNAYFRSIDSLLVLVLYRVASLLQLLPLVLAFALACAVDGIVVRIVRSKEFIQHSPEMYALTACVAIILVCSVILAAVLPIAIQPLYFAGVLLCAGFVLSRTVANFHRRG
jgi:hypothetical protein